MEHLNIAWSGDFGSLKQFFKDVLNFGGEWSQPGGDKKVFTLGKSSISWRKSKSLLHFEGEESTTIKKKICEVMLDKEISSQRKIHSSLSPEIATDEIEGLRTGQLINTEAIQSLAESIAQIASIVNEFKTNSENKTTAESQTNMGEISLSETMTEFEYANLPEDNPIVSEELADLNDNIDKQCTPTGKQNAETSANENSIIHLTNNNTQSSYSKAVKAHLDSLNISEKLIKKPDEKIS